MSGSRLRRVDLVKGFELDVRYAKTKVGLKKVEHVFDPWLERRTVSTCYTIELHEWFRNLPLVHVPKVEALRRGGGGDGGGGSRRRQEWWRKEEGKRGEEEGLRIDWTGSFVFFVVFAPQTHRV